MPFHLQQPTKKISLRQFLLAMVWLFLGFGPHICMGQQKDLLSTDSVRLFEMELSRDYEQRKIDSIEKVRLKKQLDSAAKNSTQARQLEMQLRQIAEADSIRKKQQADRIELLRQNTEGHPVTPFGDTLFWVNVRLGSTQPPERASQIETRIIKLYKTSFFSPDSLSVIKSDWGHEVVYKQNETILIVSELDALWYGRTSQELAQGYVKTVQDAIIKERKENSLVNWVKRLALIALIISGAALLIFLLNKGFRKLKLIMQKNRHRYFKGLQLGKVEVLTAAHQTDLTLKTFDIIRFITIIFGIYLCLPLLFIVFPDTEPIAETLVSWIISPARKLLSGIVHFLPNLFTIAIIYFFINQAVRVFAYFAGQLEKGQMNLSGFHPEFAKPTFNIVRFILYAFMLVLIFPYLPGSDSPAFQGVSVFLGVLFSLGSSSAINNIIAGLVITYMRPFQIGDRVKVGDLTGDVIEKTMLVIKLRTIKNEEITVPNSTILSSNTVNYSARATSSGLVIHTTVTIGYDVPWRLMHNTLVCAALRCNKILSDPKPFVWQTSLDDFYVSYQLNAYTNHADSQGEIYSEIHQHIQDCCREAGIEIMSPHYRAERSGETSTIPAQ
jgi:small-conductance mechanosensitive channel